MSDVSENPETAAPAKMRMPGAVKGVIAVLVFQALVNGAVGFLLLAMVQDDVDHGRDLEGALAFVNFIGYVSIVIAALMVVCIVLTFSRKSWVRPTVITLESIAIISGVIGLFNGAVASIAGIGLAAGVIALVNKPDSREWYRS